MKTALRIILSFIVGIIFVGITFATFFTLPQYLTISELTPSIQSQDIVGIFEHTVSNYNTLYSNSENTPEITSFTGAVYNIEVSEDGKYMSSFRKIGEQYIFSGTGFLIKQEGVGEIFIDRVTTPGKIFVYTPNTPLTITLLSNDSTEEYVDIHLTPHMYLEFQANRGKYLKNADRIRIETVFKLGYIGELGSYGDDNEYIRKYFESDDSFFNEIYLKIDSKDTQLQQFLLEFSGQRVSQIPGYDMIQRYIHIFVNDEKKIVFYKNQILEGYLKMLEIQSMDTKMVLQINKDLQVLKILDSGAYEQLLQIQENITTALYAANTEAFIIPKLLFSSLGSNLLYDKWYFPLYGFSLFNSQKKDENSLYEISHKFFQSFPIYIQQLNTGDSEIKLRYDYFLYYLEKQLMYLLSLESASKNITSIIVTFENYVNTALREDDYSVTAKVSRLFVFANILNNIDVFLRGQYFLSERTKDGVLALNPQNKISVENVISFKDNINILYDIYDGDKEYLNNTNSRDAGIIKDITQSRVKVGEYFAALENYEIYKTQYDVSKTNLLGLDAFSEDTDDSPSLDKINTYISQFTGVSGQGMSVSIVDEAYYHIENLNISGKIFDFDVSPFPEYKLSNIIIDSQNQPIQYKLGNIQDDWDEKYKTAPQEDRDQYDFSKFFFLTFFAKDDTSVEEYVNTTTIEEDKTEIVFKKDILLGNPGEFTSLNGFLNIEYADITLEKINQNYNIYLNDVDFNVSILESGGNKTYKGVLKSEYVLNNTDHYFTGIFLQVYKGHDAPKKDIFFNQNGIFIGGKIHITDIKKIIETLISQIVFYENIYSALIDIQGIQNIVLQYTTFNEKLSIKFDSGEKKYTILLRDGKIESIYKGSSKVVSEDIPISEIKNYID